MSRNKSFFITQAENDNYKGKGKLEAVIKHLSFSRESDLRRRYLKEEKLSPLKYAVMRLR